MFVEGCLLRRLVVAPRTRIRLLTRMRPQVRIEVGLLQRTVCAQRASVRLYAGVPPVVHSEAAAVSGAIIAELTAVRLLPAMYATMTVQMVFLRRAISALVASKRPGAGVRSHVMEQVALRRSAMVAVGTCVSR